MRDPQRKLRKAQVRIMLWTATQIQWYDREMTYGMPWSSCSIVLNFWISSLSEPQAVKKGSKRSVDYAVSAADSVTWQGYDRFDYERCQYWLRCW